MRQRLAPDALLQPQAPASLRLLRKALGEHVAREAAAKIGAVRDVSHRFGGSHAQRDLLSLTLIDAAWRAGQRNLARHVLAERLAQKPQGRWGMRLERRIRGEAMPRAA